MAQHKGGGCFAVAPSIRASSYSPRGETCYAPPCPPSCNCAREIWEGKSARASLKSEVGTRTHSNNSHEEDQMSPPLSYRVVCPRRYYPESKQIRRTSNPSVCVYCFTLDNKLEFMISLTLFTHVCQKINAAIISFLWTTSCFSFSEGISSLRGGARAQREGVIYYTTLAKIHLAAFGAAAAELTLCNLLSNAKRPMGERDSQKSWARRQERRKAPSMLMLVLV